MNTGLMTNRVQWKRLIGGSWRRTVYNPDGTISSSFEGDRAAIIALVVELELLLERNCS